MPINRDDIMDATVYHECGGIVHEQNGKWWFWNETWSHKHGPFETKREARLGLARYLGILNQQPDYTCP